MKPMSFQTWALLAATVACGLPNTARADFPSSATVLSDVAERVTPAVVNINTERRVKQPELQNPMFREFFGPGFERRFERGAGSGVVIAHDGLIVTNNHVVEGADEINVTFADKREFRAKLIGRDKPSDLAFLRIDAKDLPFVILGDSNQLRLGEIILAIGNPFGVGQTVTMGIVSAKGRASVGIVDYEDFIQTDAAINPGNSGGALVNLKGELVGINTAILSRSGGAQGVGFAVPTRMVGPIRDQILKEGRVRRGWLGVAIQDLTPDVARSLELSGVEGVLVSDVLEGGPASKAGVEAGDVIVRVDGRPTKSAAELRNRIALLMPGTKTELAISRDGKARNVTITLDEKDDAKGETPALGESDEIASGLEVQNLDGEARSHLGVPPRVKGVVVTGVAPGSAAHRSGLVEGDVITAVNKRPIASVDAFSKALPKGATEVLLRVYKRGGVFTFVVLRR